MKCIDIIWLTCVLFPILCIATEKPLTWEKSIPDFSSSSYKQAVNNLFYEMEKVDPDRFLPKEFQRVGLKVSTQMGAGLSTPLELTRAVIAFLEKRGFERENIFIIDQEAHRLRDAGYLPLLSLKSDLFERVPVLALSDANFFDQNWFYESPLPPPNNAVDYLSNTSPNTPLSNENRKSFIAAPLMFGLDFWINLPVLFDSPALYMRGAAVNSSLHLINNADRFFKSSVNGSVAVVEIKNIPELRNKLAANIISLEKYQYIGGPIFDSNFCVSENLILGSFDTLSLDKILFDKLNSQRALHGFPVFKSFPEYFSLDEKLRNQKQ